MIYLSAAAVLGVEAAGACSMQKERGLMTLMLMM
jgi:hypothetical protein